MDTPKIITYKEIMFVYGFGARAAQTKLTVIRSVLGKKQSQSVHIAEFCQAENIPRNLFEEELKNAIEKISPKKHFA